MMYMQWYVLSLQKYSEISQNVGCRYTWELNWEVPVYFSSIILGWVISASPTLRSSLLSWSLLLVLLSQIAKMSITVICSNSYRPSPDTFWAGVHLSAHLYTLIIHAHNLIPSCSHVFRIWRIGIGNMTPMFIVSVTLFA